MKRSKLMTIIAAFTMFMTAVPAMAQDIKSIEPEMSDYIALLNAAGYEVFNFDISSLKDDTYSIQFMTQEYVDGKLASEQPGPTLPSRKMIADFPEENQKRIISEGTAYDEPNGIYKLGKTISFGFFPTVDSLKRMILSVEGMGHMERSLKLKLLEAPGWNRRDYWYHVRPFKTDSICLDEFIPLVLVGSSWYDERYNVVRFCGEKVLSGMTSDILQHIPHYYVIGIKVQKQ